MDENLFKRVFDLSDESKKFKHDEFSRAHSISFKPTEIKKIRENHDLTLKQFSQLFSISTARLQAWESGDQKPENAELILLTLFSENKNNMSLGNLLPHELDEFILKKTPTKVRNRYVKAKCHFCKSLKLVFLDPEMAFIRLVAAEEELVVGIFETLKLKFSNIKFSKKDHHVKMALAPILRSHTWK